MPVQPAADRNQVGHFAQTDGKPLQVQSNNESWTMKLVADAMKDEDDGWFHHLRAKTSPGSGLKGKPMWYNGLTEEEYERCVG
jgi:hypothetical protein